MSLIGGENELDFDYIRAKYESIFYDYQKKMVDDPAEVLLAEKARKVGFSWVFAYRAVVRALRDGYCGTFGSTRQQESIRLITFAKQHIRNFEEFCGVPVLLVTDTKQKLEFENGTVIEALPQRAEAFRGPDGDVYLDEFAFYEQPEEMLEAALPIASLKGSTIAIWSTVWVEDDIFTRLIGMTPTDMKAFGFDPAKASTYSIDADEAIKGGCPLDLPKIRALLQDETRFMREYYLVRGKTSDLPFPKAEVRDCCNAACTPWDIYAPFETEGFITIGIDVGRVTNTTHLLVAEHLGEKAFVRFCQDLGPMPFEQGKLSEGQFEYIQAIIKRNMGKLTRVKIDSTGIGYQLAESLKSHYPFLVEPVNFTAAKDRLASNIKRYISSGNLFIPEQPYSDELIDHLTSLRRVLTPAKNFSWETRSSSHNSDLAWSLGLSLDGVEKQAIREPRVRVIRW